MQCGRHICSEAYANVKFIYSSAPDLIVDCSEFIRDIYTYIVVSCAHVLINICGISRGIFADPYMAITCEVDIAVDCVLTHICKNCWIYMPYRIMAEWEIFAM